MLLQCDHVFPQFMQRTLRTLCMYFPFVWIQISPAFLLLARIILLRNVEIGSMKKNQDEEYSRIAWNFLNLFLFIFAFASFFSSCHCQIFANIMSVPEMLFSHPGSIIISAGWRALDTCTLYMYRSVCVFAIIYLKRLDGRIELRIVNHWNVLCECSYAKCVHCLEKLEQKWSALKSPNGEYIAWLFRKSDQG